MKGRASSFCALGFPKPARTTCFASFLSPKHFHRIQTQIYSNPLKSFKSTSIQSLRMATIASKLLSDPTQDEVPIEKLFASPILDQPQQVGHPSSLFNFMDIYFLLSIWSMVYSCCSGEFYQGSRGLECVG